MLDEKFRGLGLGLMLVRQLVARSKADGDHRVILDCQEHNIAFYIRCGFHVRGAEMALYHDCIAKL